jgi:hypothetical protein
VFEHLGAEDGRDTFSRPPWSFCVTQIRVSSFTEALMAGFTGSCMDVSLYLPLFLFLVFSMGALRVWQFSLPSLSADD